MLARRFIAALLVAIAISGSFTLWLGHHLSKLRPPAPTQLRYVATVKRMEAGEILTASNLKLVTWPGGVPLAGAFVRQDEVIGRTVLYPLAEGEPLLDRQISGVGQGAGLSVRIPEGMRALSLKSDQVVGVAGYLLPGTRVDVLVTFRAASSDSMTSTVLQDAQILTAGQKMQPDPEGKASTVDVVTLLVTPQDAERVVLASAQGTVHFVLRNGADHNHVEDTPAQMSTLGAAVKDKPAVVRQIASPKAPPAPKRYSVQLMQGEKQSVESFQ